MPAEPPRGVTFTVRPRPGLTQAERLARRVRALERLLARPRPPDVSPEQAPGDGNGDRPPRRPG